MQLITLVTILSSPSLLYSALSAASTTSSKTPALFQHVSVVSSEKLEELKQSPSISVVYFFMKNSENVQAFLKEYEKSGKYLQVYNITLAVYNCTTDTSDPEICKEKMEHSIYTYQSGADLLTLTLETMFDVNSIMANALQLALLHQVPIIQSRQELQELQKTSLGKQDILFAYPVVFGTEEHRIFLEVAYAFQDRFKFALTTEFKVVQGMQNSELLKSNTGFAMLVLFCAESSVQDMCSEVLCHRVPYQGEISFPAVARFVRRLSEKNLYHLPADGLSEVFDMLDTQPIIFVYMDKNVQGHLMPLTQMAKFELKGVAKVIFVDMDDAQCKSLAENQGFSGKLPGLGFKEDGVMTFLDLNTQWSIDDLRKSIRSLVFPAGEGNSGSNPGMTFPTDLEQHVDIGLQIDEVQRQDDQIAEAVTELSSQEMELDNVPALMKNNFYKSVTSADLKLVLFYLPFDHISMAFLREFGHAAQILARNFSESNVMAHVNCYDATDLCTAENITTYPVLRVYRQDHASLDYQGSIDARSLVKAVKLLRLNSPVQLTNEDKVKNFLAGQYPQPFQNFTPSSVLLLTSTVDGDREEIFNNVAKSLSLITAFGVIRGDLSTKIAKMYNVAVPSVMAIHRSDSNKPIRVLNEMLSELSLKDFVKNSVIASVPELNVRNLPTLYARKQPFAILFMDPSDPRSKVAKELFTQIAMFGQLKNVLFCWMNAQAKTMGHRILSEYTWMPTLPMITVVDHQQGELFNYQREQLKLEDITDWLGQVLARTIRPSKMLEYAKWVPPGPHYDFLAMIDKMEKGQNDRAISDDYSRYAEQQIRRHHSRSGPTADPEREEALQVDSELREELIELQKSRIYHHNPERHEINKKRHLTEQESPPSHTHPHVEL